MAEESKHPEDWPPGMRVPRGGSNCAKCEYLDRDTYKTCTNEGFIKAGWEENQYGPAKQAGSNIIPLRIDEYCSNFFKPEHL